MQAAELQCLVLLDQAINVDSISTILTMEVSLCYILN